MNSIFYVIAFWLLLLLSCGYAMWRGRKHERIAALLFVAATIMSLLGAPSLKMRYVGFQMSDFAVDSGVLVVLIAIALVSDRFWPLWAAGLQVVDSMSHVMKAVDPEMIPQVYGVAERFWSYPILLVLAIGTWRGVRRAQRERGVTCTPI